MKKLICAAVVAASMFAMAEEAKAQATPKAEKTVETKTAEAAKQAPRRTQMTEEQRAQMRAKRDQFMAQRKAAMEAKMLEVVKKYVPDEAKAKELIAELQQAMRPQRRGGARPAPAAKPAKDAAK